MKKNIVLERFDNVSQLIGELSKRSNNQIMSNKHASQKSNDDENWSGTKTYEEAVKYILGGYEKPLDALKRGVITANTKSTSPRRCRPMNDIIGYIPNVPAAVIGLPQSMIRQDIEPKKSKIIDIIYSPTVNCDTSSSDIEKAGIAIISIINDLEKNGYRVSLSIAFYLAEEDNDRAIATVKVKDWRQPIDLKKIAFPIANAGMLRRIGFKWLETCKGLKENFWSFGYGSQLEYDEAKKLLEEQNLISDRQFFINMKFCKNCHFDTKEITTRLGMTK